MHLNRTQDEVCRTLDTIVWSKQHQLLNNKDHATVRETLVVSNVNLMQCSGLSRPISSG